MRRHARLATAAQRQGHGAPGLALQSAQHGGGTRWPSSRSRTPSRYAPGPPPTSHALLGVFRAAIADRALCVVRAVKDEGENAQCDVAGYLLLGRNTPRTVAIRNVFVAPEHRRRGLAETMVGAVTRACLGARRWKRTAGRACGSM